MEFEAEKPTLVFDAAPEPAAPIVPAATASSLPVAKQEEMKKEIVFSQE